MAAPNLAPPLRFPKQWNHWVKLAGLRHESGSFRYRKTGHYYVGRGRRWRINMYGEFQASETHDTFDRWANSTETTWLRPGTRDEFLDLVKGYKLNYSPTAKEQP